MRPLATFIAGRVRGPEAGPQGRRRIDVRRARPNPALEIAAREYLASLPRRRRLKLVLSAPLARSGRGV